MTEKTKLEKCFWGTRVWSPKPVYRSPKRSEYVTDCFSQKYNLFSLVPNLILTFSRLICSVDRSLIRGQYRQIFIVQSAIRCRNLCTLIQKFWNTYSYLNFKQDKFYPLQNLSRKNKL